MGEAEKKSTIENADEDVSKKVLKGKGPGKEQKELLEKINSQLQQDEYQLLHAEKKQTPSALDIQHFKTLRLAARAKQTFLRQALRREQQPVLRTVNQPWNERDVKIRDGNQKWLERPP